MASENDSLGGAKGDYCSHQFEEPLSGYWLRVRFKTLEQARQVAKGVIRSPGTEAVDVMTLEKFQESSGRVCCMMNTIEIWAPPIEGIDVSDQLREIDGSAVSGRYIIDDQFVCFTASAEARRVRKESGPDAPEWLDNPPWSNDPTPK